MSFIWPHTTKGKDFNVQAIFCGKKEMLKGTKMQLLNPKLQSHRSTVQKLEN